jgi:Rrf2 family protein
MKMTFASQYAVHALTAMAQGGEGRPVPSHLTARDKGIPERFLLKILKPLVNVGILHSVKGPNGGYRLAKPANQITLLEVIEAVDGTLRGFVPRTDAKAAEALDAKLEEVCQQITTQERQQLGKVRLSDLMKAGKK